MKKLSFFLAVLTQLVLLSACSEEVLEPNTPGNGSGTDTPYVIPGRPITISADMENQGAGNTRTALASDGLSVVWSEGDAFSLMTKEEDPKNADYDIVVVVSDTKQGLAIKVTSVDYKYVKYSSINITDKDNKDITSDVIKNTSTTYKVGIYNEKKQYQYATANTIITADTRTYGNNIILPLVQSSSQSQTDRFPLTVRLKGVQVAKLSGNGNKYSWSPVTDDMLLQGSEWGKNDVQRPTSFTRKEFKITQKGNSSSTFSGEITWDGAPHYAVYPHSESNYIVDDKITFTLPAEQQYVANSFGNGANPAVGILEGTEDNYHISFKNVCGVLKLQLTGYEKLASIKVIDKAGKALCGSATIPCSSITPSKVDPAIIEGPSSVVLNCGTGIQLSNQPTAFHIVVPAGAFSQGFDVEARSVDGKIATLSTSSKKNQIGQNDIKEMPAIPLEFVEELNVENPVVETYLKNAKVSLSSTGDSNYGKTFFSTARSNQNYRSDQPNTKTISFEANATTAKVIMATDAAYSNVVLSKEVELSNGKGQYTLRNFVPGNTYYYKVEASGVLLTAGALHATGQMRMIAVDNGFNIRDLGGWTGWNGNTVRYENIYRGGALGGTNCDKVLGVTLTESDKQELNRIGIGALLDLRAISNGGCYRDEKTVLSYANTESPISNWDFNNTMTDFGAYGQDASIISDVAWIIYELKNGKSVYFNCRQGADRTGALAFIIEGLLGCYGNDTGHQMALDYELTGFSRADIIDTAGDPYRAATEASPSSSKLFGKLQSLTATNISFNNLQEKCYYYLNRYAKENKFGLYANNQTSTLEHNEIAIDKEDLNWFINYMLGITDREGNLLPGKTKYQGPSWQFTGDVLKTIGEENASKVIYAQ